MGIMTEIRRKLHGCDSVGHRPVRSRIKNDGKDFRSVCRDCGVPLIRYGSGDWRTDTSV